MPSRPGRKSAAQTPAPKSDKIYGSRVNKAKSADSAKSAKSIVFSDKLLKTLKDKADKYNENHSSKVSVNTLKAVFRRGAGAYSKSHRPTITGGAPNSRNAWAFARVNKFLLKKGGTKVKAAYVQDDDLLEKGGKVFNDKELLAKWKKGESIGFTGEAHLKAKGLIPRANGKKIKSEKYMEQGGLNQDVVCVNCGWGWNTADSDESDKYVCHKCGFDNTLYYNDDIINNPKKIALPDTYSTFEGLKPILENQGYNLVEIDEMPANGTFEDEFKEGGVVVGKRHSEEDENGTGERFLVESTGQIVEVEGGEGVLCKESMNSDKLYDMDGKKMTGRQIASMLNHKYGGVEFADGGEVGHVCGCRTKWAKFYHGGELPSATLQGLSGGEAVVTVKTMESKDKYKFQGRMMTPREILSKINSDAGGKKFEEGGTIDITKNIMDKTVKLTKMVYFTENILYS
jgi:hypothetical protein